MPSERHRICLGKVPNDTYEREIEVRASEHGVNVSIFLFGVGGGPVAAGLTLPVVEATQLLQAVAEAIAAIPSPSEESSA